MKRLMLIFSLALAALASAETEAPLVKPESLPESVQPRHVRVLWMESPATQAVVSWSTTLPGKDHEVRLDTTPRGGDLRRYDRRVREVHSGEYTRTKDDLEYGEPPLYYHHAVVDGLSPATTYHFVVSSDDQVSREFHFMTAPDDDRDVRVLFGGDSRIGGSEPYQHEDRRAVNRRMAALAEAHPDLIAFCHGGDFYQRADLRYMKPWLTDHELTVTSAGRIVPIVVARGNHDRGVGFEEMFRWPGEEHDYYYVTQLSAKVALVTLNTEISLAGDQSRWLGRTLRKLRPANDWLFVQYHKPAYPSVRGWSDGADRRYYFVPQFEEHNVDLVMESHDHALKRTLPIRDGGPHPRGITYIGDGGLGVPQRTPDPTRWYLQPPGMVKAVHHVQLVEFSKAQLRIRAFGIDGEVHDDCTLAPQPIGPEAAEQ